MIVAACVAALALIAAPAQADAWRLGFVGGGHYPKAGKPWPLKVTARKDGAPLRAKLLYQYLFAGQVVNTGSPYGAKSTKPYPFRGQFRDKLRWPKRSIGYDLTFRVIVRVKGKPNKQKDYAVKVRR